MAKSTLAMADSILGRFPQEIRDQINILAVTHDGPVTLVVTASVGKVLMAGNHNTFSKILTGLPATCKQARRECRELVWSENSFHVELEQSEDDPTFYLSITLLDSIFRYHPTQNIKTMTFDTGKWYLDQHPFQDMGQTHRDLTYFKRGLLLPSANVTATFTFDWTDFPAVDGVAETITETVTVIIGATTFEGLQRNVAAFAAQVQGKMDAYMTANPEAGDAEKFEAEETFWRFFQIGNEALRRMAYY